MRNLAHLGMIVSQPHTRALLRELLGERNKLLLGAFSGGVHHDLNVIWDYLCVPEVPEICVRARAACSRFGSLEHCLARFA